MGNLEKAPNKLRNSPTKFNDKGVPALLKHKIKNIIENNGIICVNPLYTEINLVCDLSYNIPPTHINRPEDTKPCPSPNNILPSIP
jgi:hypothetical protein